MTAFIHARVDIGGGRYLIVDGNSKITGANGTYAEPKPNALSLPAASVSGLSEHCPGSTAVCRSSCYVRGLAKHAPEIYAAYEHNARVLAEVLAVGFAAGEAAVALADWITANAPHGFRWHVSGDVQGWRHARWIAKVSILAPRVPFWIYTRTFEAVPTLMRAPNLAVNISADSDNWVSALACHKATGARITYLSHDGQVSPLPPDSVIFPDYALRGRELADPTAAPWWQSLTHEQRAMTCPADFFGQSEAHRCGPCGKCLTP